MAQIPPPPPWAPQPKPQQPGDVSSKPDSPVEPQQGFPPAPPSGSIPPAPPARNFPPPPAPPAAPIQSFPPPPPPAPVFTGFPLPPPPPAQGFSVPPPQGPPAPPAPSAPNFPAHPIASPIGSPPPLAPLATQQRGFAPPPPPPVPSMPGPIDLAAPHLNDETDVDEEFESTVVIVRGSASSVTDWKLIDIDGREFDLHSSNVLGRKPAVAQAPEGAQAVSLSDPARVLSRTHALLEVEADELWVTDLSSTNGTRALYPSEDDDDQGAECPPQQRVRLPTGKILSLGGRRLIFAKRS